MLLVGLAFLLIFKVTLSNMRTVRKFSKSPHFNERVSLRLSSEGVHVTSELQNTLLDWDSFTHVSIVDDGVLLFRGPDIFHLFPNDSFHDSSKLSKFHDWIQMRFSQ